MAILLAFLFYCMSIVTSVHASPIVTGKCGPAEFPTGVHPIDCCPPAPPLTKFRDFILPSNSSSAPRRVRPAAHLVDRQYVNKYKRAVELMKALPSTDPRSFMQQANLHCAYCSGAYKQSGFSNLSLQIHNSWLFFPWHRYYLYFYEKILGKLIDDPTFALPFWNWDAPGGMQMPSMYTDDPTSPLYDPRRNPNHQPPTLISLNWDFTDSKNISSQDRISSNIAVMHKQMVSASGNASQFLGLPYRAGDKPNPIESGGSVEIIPHGPIHAWTGDNRTGHLEDMGSFYSAGRDPIFFGHHANIDRMWTLWKTLGGARFDYESDDWLDATFLFHDENASPVRVKVRDCIDEKKMGYEYQAVDIPWL